MCVHYYHVIVFEAVGFEGAGSVGEETPVEVEVLRGGGDVGDVRCD